MRVLCCLDGTNADQIGTALKMFTAVHPLTVGMLHVTDTRPRDDMELIRERFWRHPLHPHDAPAPRGSIFPALLHARKKSTRLRRPLPKRF